MVRDGSPTGSSSGKPVDRPSAGGAVEDTRADLLAAMATTTTRSATAHEEHNPA